MSGRRVRHAGVVVSMAMMLGLVAPASPAAADPIRFGSDIESLDRASSRGLPLNYGTFWLGSWTQRYGWGHAQQQLQAAVARNVTPVVHWWYWGDDISPDCVERGCQDRYQGVWKDKATWYRMTDELGRVIAQSVGNREVIVIVETEFNKGGIETYAPFDGYLADQAAILRRHGNIKVVIAFGNWGHNHWSRFSRSTQSADYLATQLLRSSVRDAAIYTRAVDDLVSGTRYLHSTFGKPTMVIDLALSSYPSSAFETIQASVTIELFSRMSELKNAGVRVILYRMIADDPDFDPNNYHGQAERHWGLLRADGSEKPAFARFVEGVRQEQASPGAPAPGPQPLPTPPGGGACSAPGAPQSFASDVRGSVVTLQWGAPQNGAATSYVVEAGSAPGLANLAVVEVGPNGVQVTAPPGVYYARIRARNACGVSGASNEQIVRVF